MGLCAVMVKFLATAPEHPFRGIGGLPVFQKRTDLYSPARQRPNGQPKFPAFANRS